MLTPTTVRSVALQLYRGHGIPGLYRGLTATALRDCGYGAYFFAVSWPWDTLSAWSSHFLTIKF